MAKEAVEAVHPNRTNNLIIEAMFVMPERPVGDKNDGVIADDERKKKRWIEHFQ